MTLVAMINIFLDTKFLECKYTTNTKQNFLLQTVFPVTSIQRMGNTAIKLRVHLVVSIQQIKLDSSNVNTPNISMNMVVHIRNIHNHWCTVLSHLLFYWQ